MLRISSTASSATLAVCALLLLLLLRTTNKACWHGGNSQEFDLVIFGATGYVGSLLTAMLFDDRAPFLSLPTGTPLTPGVKGVRYALAGRDENKLRQLRQKYADQGIDMSRIELIVADSSDPASLDRLAARTRIVLTTVAVTSLYEAVPTYEYTGSLLEACINHGTHLLDLDGELLMDMVDTRRQVDAAARASGTIYSPACGEVAVVPDMAIYRAWVELGRVPLKSATLRHYYFDGLNKPADEEQPSMWQDYHAPVMRLTAATLGYGNAFAFSELSATNAAHEHAVEKNTKADVRAVARFVTAADVEAVNGGKVTTTISGGEIDYEDTARIAMVMALSLLKDDIPARGTGGVWSPAAGWGEVLLERLEDVGLGVKLAAKAETAATVMRSAREKFSGRYA